MDVFPYPFKDGSVDVIVASGLIGHLKHPIKFWREIRRILNDNGEAYILKCTCCNTKFNRNVYFEKNALEMKNGEYIIKPNKKSFEGSQGFGEIPVEVVNRFGQDITDVYLVHIEVGEPENTQNWD